MATAHENNYYIPEPSKWPVVAVLGLFTLVFGIVLWVNEIGVGPYTMALGGVILAYLLFGWFGDVIDENQAGRYNHQVERSFRQGMIWFITSEVFFFITFFGCLFYFRVIAVPWLGGEGQLGKSNMLWEGFQAAWPLLQLPDATNYTPAKQAMGAAGIPAWNTAILLTSGVTLTFAHWALKKSNQKGLVLWLFATIALGFAFFALQVIEYGHAYADLNLKLTSGVYGSIFYMLTGFHGFHVTIGAIMLTVILVRSAKGHFTPKNHFAFEAVAWYWHFVDVVWLGLFFLVYWI